MPAPQFHAATRDAPAPYAPCDQYLIFATSATSPPNDSTPRCPVAPRSQRFAPSRFFSRQFQHSALPRILAQQPAPEIQRSFTARLWPFPPCETFRDVPIVRISHRPPESHRNARLSANTPPENRTSSSASNGLPVAVSSRQFSTSRGKGKTRHDRRPPTLRDFTHWRALSSAPPTTSPSPPAYSNVISIVSRDHVTCTGAPQLSKVHRHR